MRVLVALLLVLWPVEPDPGRASLATVKRWNAATVASLIKQLQRPEFDNARYYMALRLPEFDSVSTQRQPPFRISFRLSFLQYLDRASPQLLAQPLMILEYFSHGEMNVLRNAVLTQEKGKAKVTFFEYRYGWLNQGSRFFSQAEAQQLLHLSLCYEQGTNNYELVVTRFPVTSTAIQSDYFVEQSICAPNGILKAFAHLGR
jgi:hypothetical protein